MTAPGRARLRGAERAAQLTLEVGRQAEFSFSGFVPGPNDVVLAALRDHARGGVGVCYLWGAPGTGKTHLLRAACAARGADAMHLSLRAAALDPAILAGLERLGLICLDDVDAVAGQAHWDEALFHLFNRIDAVGGVLLVGARCSPAGLAGVLADLRSRLGAGLVLQLRPLADEDRREALRGRAAQLGFALADDVCDYLLRRYSRDMHDLLAVVEALDRETLATQRRPTVPLLKAILGEP